MSEPIKPTGMPLPDALAGNFQDAVRWFNQLWSGTPDPAAAMRAGGGALPSMMMPTLDVKELEKRITDLRSVENWLNLNLSLLRTTIQGLEMQRSTLAAWQALGASATAPAAGAAAGAMPKAEAAGGATAPGEMPAFQPALWWAALQQQFAQMAASATAQAASAASAQGGGEAGAGAEAPPGAAKGAGKTKAGGPGRS